MGRRYRVLFEQVSVSAAQDLLQIKGASGKLVKIIRQWWGNTDTTAPTNQDLPTRSRVLPVTVTDGSGGSTPTIQKTDLGDAAASFTALANNTTKATTNGTAVIAHEAGDNIFAGHAWDYPDKSAPMIGPSQSFVFELLAGPTGTVKLSGGVEVEEIGG